MAVKTYILPPNLTTHPGGALAIGSIIADPLRPLKSLSTPPQPLETVTHHELDSELTHSDRTSFSGSVWSQFLQVATAKVGGGRSSEHTSSFAVDRLETISLAADVSDEYAATRASEPRVRAAMNAGMFGRAPVYMISGLKIAKGFRWEREDTTSRQADVGASAPITEEVGLGAEVSAEKAKLYRYASRTDDDIVFAYQLHVIADKGWRKRTVSADLHVPKGGLLRKNSEGELEEDTEALPATAEEVVEVAGENEDATTLLSASDGGGQVACIVMRDGGGFDQ